jgi:hypothetical protein
MSLSASDKKIRLKEQRIGRKAAQAVENYVKSKIRSKLSIRNKGGVDANGKAILPILEATKVKAKTGTHRLLGLNLTSNKYGFIQHYGAIIKRTEHIVLNSRKTSFIRHSHPFKLKSKDIFDDIYQKSGALKILADGLSETRTAAVSAHIKGVVLELNKKDNG